jgi:hypothetical protein
VVSVDPDGEAGLPDWLDGELDDAGGGPGLLILFSGAADTAADTWQHWDYWWQATLCFTHVCSNARISALKGRTVKINPNEWP